MFLIVVTLALCSCQRERADHKLMEPGVDAVLSPSASALLDEKKLTEMKKKALAGDQPAAAIVVEHYLGASSTLSADQLYWLSIASENGAPGEMYNYALALMQEGGMENCIRANFWLTQIAKSAATAEVKRQAKDIADIALTDARCLQSKRL